MNNRTALPEEIYASELTDEMLVCLRDRIKADGYMPEGDAMTVETVLMSDKIALIAACGMVARITGALVYKDVATPDFIEILFAGLLKHIALEATLFQQVHGDK